MRRITLLDLQNELRRKGVNVDKYEALVRQAYSNMSLYDEACGQAVQSVVLEVAWREGVKHGNAKFSNVSMGYERRQNGYEDDIDEQSSLPRLSG